MKTPENKAYVLFGGIFVLANKLQLVADQSIQILSCKQWFLLRSLQDLPPDPPPTITSLAQETDTSRQNTRQLLEALQKQGYVALNASSHDRRSQVVQMTEAGKKVLRQVAGASPPFFHRLFDGISTEERDIAAKVILQMIENLQGMQKKENKTLP